MNIEILPVPVKKGLNKLGNDIRIARIKRRLTMSKMANYAGICRTTLTKIEKGDANVSIGNYGTVVFILGLIDNFDDFTDVSRDKLGLSLDTERLPKRVRVNPKIKENHVTH